MLLASLFVLAVLYYPNVLGDQHVCDFGDGECLTTSAKQWFPECINGDIEGVPCSESLTVDFIKADLEKLKYTLKNTNFQGLKSCNPEYLNIDNKTSTYDIRIVCEHLIKGSQYVIDGYFGCMPVKGEGDMVVNYYNYVYILNGTYEKIMDGNKPRIQIKDFDLNIDARDKVVYDLKNLFNGDVKKTIKLNKYANKNWKLVDKTVRQPTMEKFSAKLVENVNMCFKKMPIQKIISYESDC